MNSARHEKMQQDSVEGSIEDSINHCPASLRFVIAPGLLMGQTVGAAVAKQFDSVVKAICGVVGIIFPTWVVSYLVGWEDLDPRSSAGQLKLTGVGSSALPPLSGEEGRMMHPDQLRENDMSTISSGN
eukprot:s5005_g1.t1